ncbi:hypothetical protein ACJRO7_015803 [Eucalyptus globulus]|uniref:Uncharacterized protein n=1 Tax=Eucalyptus globulus TaxID=34317 RepID=A0ABD3L8K3_EUCGL
MDRDDGHDAVSNLPDSVLLHVLSFLPTRDAVGTTSTRHLSFDHCPYHDCKKLETAFEVDDRFSPMINSFRLNLNCASEVHPYDPKYEDYATPERRRTWNKLDTWIPFATRRKVKFLDLDFLRCAWEFRHCLYFPLNLYVLPSIVLRCSSLVELKLASCVVRPVAGRVQLRLLRKLFMRKIDLTDNKMADILSGRPLLKELSLEDCYGLHEPKFCCGPSIEELNLERCGGLQKLDLTQSVIKHLKIDPYGNLELVCPNVNILDIAGYLDYVKVTDVLSLYRLLLEKLSCNTYFMPCVWCILLAEAGWKLAFEFNGYSYWSSVDVTIPCLEHQLKHVKIYGYPDVIELFEFLLKNAQVPERMEISTKKTLQRTGNKYIFASDIGCP